MTKLSTTLISLLFLFTSCKMDLDYENLQSITDYGAHYLAENDMKNFMGLTELRFDQSILKQALIGANWKEVEDLLASNNIILKKQVIVDDVKIVGNSSINFKDIHYYLMAGEDYYDLKINIDKNENEYYFDSCELTNLSRECNNIPFKPYTNENLHKVGVYWSKGTDRSFNEFGIRVKNNSNKDYSVVKYRLILTDYSGKEFFNRVLNYNKGINVDELKDFEVPELKGYITSFPIGKGKFKADMRVQLLTIRPDKEQCMILSSLD